MSDTAFVRTKTLPQHPPPVLQAGPIAWARENLFSGWFNSILTLLSLGAVWWLVGHIWPWFARSVWNAGSLVECREIIQATWGPDATGACFAVINERWQQFLFGFYPPDLYWRPVLTFVLMLASVAPVLFPGLPRKMLWLSLAFPGLAYWLLWGGSLLVPMAIYAGPVIGWLAHRAVASRSPGPIGLLAGIAATMLWWSTLAGPAIDALSGPLGFLSLQEITSKQFGGFLLSVVIGVTGIVMSLPIGIVLALGRQSDMMLVKALCVGFIEFIRGVPLITLLLVASFLLNIFLPPGTNFDIILRVIIMVTLFASAYMAEVIRGGLAALPRGQYEAADALGLDYWKSMRLIIMPQALKISIPGIVNTFIGLFKDTTLVAIIALLDPIGLTTAVRADSNWNGIIWELYGFVALIFFIFCYAMSQYSQYLERKLETGHR